MITLRRTQRRGCTWYKCAACGENAEMSDGGALIHLGNHRNNGFEIDEDLYAELEIEVASADTIARALR